MATWLLFQRTAIILDATTAASCSKSEGRLRFEVGRVAWPSSPSGRKKPR